MKKRWLFAPIAIAVLAMGVATAGVAMAQETDTNRDSRVSNFISRVAEILGLEESQVREAVAQARREMRDEAFQQKLDRLVDQGRITREEADEYLDWYLSRPDTLRGHRMPGFGFDRRGDGRHGPGRGLRGFEGRSGPPRPPSAGSVGEIDDTVL